MVIPMKKTKRPMTKAKFSKVVITSVLAAVALFTVAMIFLYSQYGGVPDTLIVSFFTFCGGEAGILGVIKVKDKSAKTDDGANTEAVG